MNGKLTRSSQDKMIGGVCGGLGEYFQINPIIVRIFFLLWIVIGEWGIIAYFLLWLIMPPQQYSGGDFQIQDIGARFRLIGNDIRDVFQDPSPKLLTYGGIMLVGVGVVTLLRALGLDWSQYWNSTLVWAGLLIVGGVFILVKTYMKKK
ncbi:MAG: PspC domain-containing protein [Chloroflexi bacterium]|nr:PspC domain-containing protein [Chloroflexota bacterium]